MHGTLPARRRAEMSKRTSCRTVTFTRPFLARGIVEEQPAGSCSVETDEEPLETASVVAYRRISTLIRLPGSSVLGQVVDIDPEELAQALERDCAAPS
jgi:hypothetical protein